METEQQVHSFIKSAGRIALPPAPTSTPHSLPQSFAARSTLTPHPLTRRILTLMEDKGTNLALSADVSSSQQLLKVPFPPSLAPSLHSALICPSRLNPNPIAS